MRGSKQIAPTSESGGKAAGPEQGYRRTQSDSCFGLCRRSAAGRPDAAPLPCVRVNSWSPIGTHGGTRTGTLDGSRVRTGRGCGERKTGGDPGQRDRGRSVSAVVRGLCQLHGELGVGMPCRESWIEGDWSLYLHSCSSPGISLAQYCSPGREGNLGWGCSL